MATVEHARISWKRLTFSEILQIYAPFPCFDLSFKYRRDIQPLLQVLMCQAAFEMGSRVGKAPEQDMERH